jgi:hypothetical protein
VVTTVNAAVALPLAGVVRWALAGSPEAAPVRGFAG